jgi:hypothetical protein
LNLYNFDLKGETTMSSEEKFVYESVQDPQTIKEYLESLE